MNHGVSIAIAARRTGLSQHVIRAWEKRYGAIRPSRTDTKRRLYSDEEIERLQLLRRATQAGHSIGNIATLAVDALRILAEEKTPDGAPKRLPDTAETILSAALDAVRSLDCTALESVLQSGVVTLGRGLLTLRVIVPLIQQIGDGWERGTLRIAHEHCVSAVIRTMLGSFVHAYSPTANAPVLVVTTPPGQVHELGALIVASTATDCGWKVVYLGPSLPPEEIAAVYERSNANALALSIIYPADDPTLPAQLRAIRQLLPTAPIIAGGRATVSYQAVLSEVRFTVCEDIASTIRVLEAVRMARIPSAS